MGSGVRWGARGNQQSDFFFFFLTDGILQPLLMLVKLNPLAMDFYLGMTLDLIPLLLYLLLITMSLFSSRSCPCACGCNVSLGVSLQEYNDLR